jgi:hypothetical protein
MRKEYYLCALIVLFTSVTVEVSAQDQAAQKEEFKPSGKPFFVMFTNIHTTFSDNKYLTAFELNRGYLGYDYSFSRQISARIIYDATAQTVNGNVMMQGYLRNAFLQFDNGTFQFKGGLIPSEHLFLADKLWNYRYIARPLIDISGMIYSADLGISFKYKPSDIAAFDVSITNGRGYKDLAADSTFRYSAGITLIPVKNLTVRGYFDFMPEDEATQWTTGVMCVYSGTKFSVGAEFDMQKNHSYNKGHNYSGFAIFGSYTMNEKVGFFGRFYEFSSVIPNGEITEWNSANDNKTIVAGIDYSPVKGIRISPNVTYIDPDATGAAGKTVASLNFEVKF